MHIVIEQDGSCRCLYSEEIDLGALGRLSIQRGSHVEPNADGKWIANLGPVDGPQLGPFPNRSQALRAERDWLTLNWLLRAESARA